MAEYKTPQYRSQLIERPTLDTSSIAGTGLASFAKGVGALGSAFGGAAMAAQRKEQAEDKAAFEQTQADIFARLQSDPKGAYEAYRTGDYSAFSDVEVKNHAILGRSVPEFIGKISAVEAKQELKRELEQTDPLVDGKEFVRQWTQEKLGEKPDPYFASAFTEGVTKYSYQMLEDRRNSINKATITRVHDAIPLLVDEVLPAVTSPEDLESAMASTIQAMTSAGVPLVDAREAARTRWESRIMEVANDPEHPHHGKAWDLATRPDANGVSMATRNQNAWKKAAQTAASNSNILNGRARRMTDEVGIDLGAMIKGKASTSDVLGHFAEYQKAMRAAGAKLNSSSYLALKKKVMDYAASNSASFDAHKRTKDGENLPWSVVGKAMDDYRDAANNGNREAAAKLRDMEGVYGATSKGKTDNSKALATNPVETITRVTGLMAAKGRDAVDFFEAKDVNFARGVMMYAKGVDEQQLATVLPQLIADRAQLGSNGTNPYLGLWNQTQGTGDRAQKEGERGLKLMTTGLFEALGEHYGSEVKQTLEMRSKIRDAIGVATLLNFREGGGVGSVDNDKIQATALEILKDEGMAPATDRDGNVVMIPDQTAAVTSINGRITQNTKLTPEVIKEAHKFVAEGVEGASVRADELTKRNGLLTVYTEQMGIEMPMQFIPGTPQVIAKTEADRMFPYLEQSPEDRRGFVTVIIPSQENATTVDLGPATKGTYKDGTMTIQVDPMITHAERKARKWQRRAEDAFDQLSIYPEQAEAILEDMGVLKPDMTPEQVQESILNEYEEQRKRFFEETRAEVPGPGIEYLDDAGEGNTMHPALVGSLIRHERAKYEKTKEEVLKALMDNGVVGPRAKKAIENLPNYDDIPQEAVGDMATRMTAMLGEPEALGDPEDLTDFITHVETGQSGYSRKAYEDSFKGPDGKLNKAMSIGYGISLERPDIESLLKDAGAPSKAEILKGAEIDETMARNMKEAALEKTKIWLRKHFEGVALEPNQWIALISMAYNSKWNEKGPKLIGPNITAAIKRGDMKAAHDEILYRSAGVDNPKYKAGILKRRQKEAALFAGEYDVQEIVDSKDFTYKP